MLTCHVQVKASKGQDVCMARSWLHAGLGIFRNAVMRERMWLGVFRDALVSERSTRGQSATLFMAEPEML